MKQPMLHASNLPWEEKRNPSITPDRRGFFKNLSAAHGLTQFEARITRIPPGESSTWYHRHSHIEEWFYVLAGSCEFCLHGVWSTIKAGDSVATRPEDWHTFRNRGNQECEIIMVGIEHPEDKAERAGEPPDQR